MTRPEGTTWQTHHGVTYGMWNSPDKIGRIFQSGKVYEQPLLEWIYEQPFTVDSVVLDVGGNIGNHALWMAKVCGLIVHSFEPVMPHVLRANAHLNQCQPNLLMVHDCGLGNETAEYHHTSRGELKRGKSAESTDEVLQICKMDSFNFENIDLIKIDVEGMELDVLRGGMETISICRPIILVEEWQAETTWSVARLLKPLGYKRELQFGGGRRKTAPMGVWKADK